VSVDLSFVLNGFETRVAVRPGQRLLDVLRDDLRLTGTKEGCGEGECGACTVLVDGCPVNSCLFPALEAEGRCVTTIEGLGEPAGRLSVLQECFVLCGAIQCGFCTPGMVLSAKALLDADPDPTQEEIREALSGNLCRCTGYVQIVEAVVRAAARLRGGPVADPSAAARLRGEAHG
jgi:carbon-monoxide dehydrogenase small subunit